jgi:type IV pilus assembly protein PilA
VKKQKGFSLIELLIVVAIILIIAAIAIPNLLRAKISANEASAVGSMRTIVTGEISYAAAGWTNAGAPVGYSVNLSDLGGVGCAPPTSTATCLIDPVLANAVAATPKSGYYFAYVQVGGGTSFTLNGNPAAPGQTGSRYFFADQSGVLRFNPAAVAAVTDVPLQ